MSIPRERLLALLHKKCQIWSTTFNPDGIRTGNKILRAKLKGPGLAAYYPRRTVTLRDFQRDLEKINLTFDNEEEEDRLDKIEELKDRGKGAPKKKKIAPTELKPKKK